MVEAVDPFQMIPTSMFNKERVVHNNRMLWMRICMSPYHVTTDLFCQSFGDFSRILVTTLGRKIKHSVVVEAVDPFQMTPTSMSNTYKVFHNPHILYMCIHNICIYFMSEYQLKILFFLCKEESSWKRGWQWTRYATVTVDTPSVVVVPITLRGTLHVLECCACTEHWQRIEVTQLCA